MTYTITLPDTLAEQIAERARSEGQTPEAVILRQLEQLATPNGTNGNGHMVPGTPQFPPIEEGTLYDQLKDFIGTIDSREYNGGEMSYGSELEGLPTEEEGHGESPKLQRSVGDILREIVGEEYGKPVDPAQANYGSELEGFPTQKESDEYNRLRRSGISALEALTKVGLAE